MALTEASPLASQPPQTEAGQTEADGQSTATVPAILHRPRRLRRTETLRRMVRETSLHVEDLIYPLFVMEGEGQREEVPSMPGCYRYTLDLLLDEVKESYELGLGAIALTSFLETNGNRAIASKGFSGLMVNRIGRLPAS